MSTIESRLVYKKNGIYEFRKNQVTNKTDRETDRLSIKTIAGFI